MPIVRPTVLNREAVVCVRQPMQAQVRMNLESQRRLYELVEEAKHRRVRDIEVIDDDLDRSMSSMVARPDFARLVAWLCGGEIGTALCLDASQLARNGPRNHPRTASGRPRGYSFASRGDATDPCGVPESRTLTRTPP